VSKNCLRTDETQSALLLCQMLPFTGNDSSINSDPSTTVFNSFSRIDDRIKNNCPTCTRLLQMARMKDLYGDIVSSHGV